MTLVVIRSILGPKEKEKIEDRIKCLLDPNDFDNWFVYNGKDKDYFLLRISYRKIDDLVSFFREINVLIDSWDMNLDNILDKISMEGIDSLQEYEKIYLNEYK
jgi:hypothetical protein